tara:strand:- start:717 stop:1070 length:354 start_codon:yes stop_codon:yes gene_type:complete
MARILVVDDKENSILAVQSLLKDGGHSISSAGDERVALEKLRSGPFDIALVDLDIPGNVENVFNYVKDESSSTLIIMSGFSGEYVRDTYSKEDFPYFHWKYHGERLPSIINSAFHSR